MLVAGSEQSVALVVANSGETLTYAELDARVDRRAVELAALAGAVVLLGASMTVETVVDYLALSSVGATTAMLDPDASAETVERWIAAYQPEGWWGFRHGGERVGGLGEAGAGSPRAEAVLLATSGSTGSPKFVRLSAGNVVANARQIATAIGIRATDRALAHLPLFYSFGLSVLNSHLAAGASVVLCEASAIRPEFWTAMREHDVTMLAGVPYSFEMFQRAGLGSTELPSLRAVLQAGGKLATPRILHWHELLAANGVALWVMYGQTEATARICILPSGELPDAAGSVGYPVPGGSVEIRDPDADGVGELVYSGPNVMLGYASSRADLSGLDELGGALATGDLARLDDVGRVWITGRLKRIAKVFGVRVSLDDVEGRLREFGTLAAVDDGNGIGVFLECEEVPADLSKRMERALALPPRSIRVRSLEHLPLTVTGKIDYEELRRRC